MMNDNCSKISSTYIRLIHSLDGEARGVGRSEGDCARRVCSKSSRPRFNGAIIDTRVNLTKKNTTSPDCADIGTEQLQLRKVKKRRS